MLPPSPSSPHAADAGNGSSSARDRSPRAPTASVSVSGRGTTQVFWLTLIETDCVYQGRRKKVERTLYGQTPGDDGDDAVLDTEPCTRRVDVPSPLETVLSTLARELQSLNQNITSPHQRRQEQDDTASRPRKRPRSETLLQDGIDHELENQDFSARDISLDEVLDELLDVYFSHLQPWIPMIREGSFRNKIQRDGAQSQKVILWAMAVAALRFVERDGELLPADYTETTTSRLRRLVLLTAMDGLGVENLQALIIIAFVDIGDGNMDKAWPIIGSLTRTVEYMELSVEAEDRQRRPAVWPSPASTSPPLEWVEEEERRRIFWNIFILDRLPICGGKWYDNEHMVTPYFGIWDRSRAKIGNSIAYLPGHYPSPSHSIGSETADPGLSGVSSRGRRGPASHVDMSMVGAFAYYVESIESLSQITTYFLQTDIDFNNRQDVSSWLTRFKELDLRLVHWKMYLPQQWKDSGVSRETMPGVMDPNMTVANATHNISLILLHERIAYPDAELSGVRLPSLWSADTCYSAAVETANITTKYLEGSQLPVSPQLGICAFVSGRILLVHWRHYKTSLADEFRVLVDNLKEMSSRWANRRMAKQPCFFLQLASRLDNVYHESQQMLAGGSVATGSLRGLPGGSTGSKLCPRGLEDAQSAFRVPEMPVVSAPGGSIMPGQGVGEQGNGPWLTSDAMALQTNAGDDLSAISQILMDNDFMEMDRIISFEDMMSAGDLSRTML
ncbi:hypothetical protein FZEAL_8523 [Fusarium zealandicum]|uniref:Xylanolytic transcriptional activator regulatory domain-containing protein n=1 Tax=Fusarium zealandicum TaxID=1053134 RepID=A0A8H4UE15_9HYPO|nr:hypothetical protein FZEAL_8523 [Fusarium zealandicum]